jgi:acyl carrier protein
MTNIDDRIIDAIRKSANPHQAIPAITPDLHLFDAKIVDSFGVISLVAELEAIFKISIATEDLTIQNFDTPATIAKLVQSYIGRQKKA